MTPDEIQAIRKRRDAATWGPWSAARDDVPDLLAEIELLQRHVALLEAVVGSQAACEIVREQLTEPAQPDTRTTGEPDG